MPRVETADRLLSAALRLGVDQGVGALSLQGIANGAGVSKALVLYHYGDKPTLLSALVEHLGARSVERMRAAARAGDALVAWRALARTEAEAGELALLAGLAREGDVSGSGTLIEVRAAREDGAATLGTAILRGVRLGPRVPVPFLGRLIVRHLDGLAVAAGRGVFAADELEAELDTFALALLGLGR